jgi:TRAP-type C4-dicarboxylate transport system permease small subunit
VDRARVFLIRVLEGLTGLLLMGMTGVTLAQVLCRYFLGFSLPWSHELVVLMLIWVVWLSIPVGLARGAHLTVSFVFDQVPAKVRLQMERLNWVLSLFFVGLAFFLTFPVADAFEGMNLLTLPIPTNARYYAATAGSLLSVLVLLGQLFERRKET